MMIARMCELLFLFLRCSAVESVREFVSTQFAFFNAKKSPYATDPRTVCIIAENNVWGGTERHTRELIRGLIADGFHVKYISAATHVPDPELGAIESLLFENIPTPLSIHAAGNMKAWVRLLRQIKSYVVILPCPRTAFGSFSFLSALRRSFHKIIYIEHASPSPLPEGMARPGVRDLFTARGMDNWIEHLRRTYRMRCADHIITVSDAARRALIESWPVSQRRVTTIHNGVNETWAQVTPAMREEARQRYGISRDSFVFGMVTRLSPEKGVDLAIRAFARFSHETPARNAKLIIAGTGPQEMTLRRLAQELGVSDRVVWLGFEKNPMLVYGLLDTIVFSSRQEGLPLSLLEAMATGVIPVAFDVGGIPEVIIDPSLGWLVSSGDIDLLTQAMQEACELSTEERFDHGHKLREHIQTRFDFDTSLKRLMDVSGLLDDSTWKKTYALSKVRDACDAWWDFLKLWVYAHLPAETADKLERGGEREASGLRGKPAVCFIEESGGWGGAENHTYMLIQYLQKHDYPIEYVCGRQSLPVPPDGIQVNRAAVSIFDDNAEAEACLLAMFAPLKSRVLIFPALDVQFGMSMAFMKAVRRSFDRIIYIEHTLPPPMPTRTRKRYLGGLIPGVCLWWQKEQLRRKLRMRCPSHIVAVSDSVREAFIDTWKCPPEKIVTIRNGVDCHKFDVTETQRQEARERFNIPKDTLVFGMMARLSQEKGVDLAVRAFAGFCTLEPTRKARLVVGGAGPESDALGALCEELGISDRVHWAGFIEDTCSVFALMDVLLASSRVEGLPLALLEGMATGAIPIVFRVGGMPEVISDPALGWVVEPGDISAFSQAMREVAGLSQEQVQAYRSRVRQCVHEKFNLEMTNGRIAELIV